MRLTTNECDRPEETSVQTSDNAVPRTWSAGEPTPGSGTGGGCLPWFFRATPAPFPASYCAQLLADPRALVLVAEVEGRVVGYAIALLRDSRDIPPLCPRRFVYLEDLGVDRDHQRRGLGRALVAACIAWDRDQGATALELNVFDFNESALRFYERLGLVSPHRQMRRAI